MKKVLVLILAFSMSGLVYSSSHAASTPDEQWYLPINAPGQDGQELIGVNIATPTNVLGYPSYIAGDSKGQNNRQDMLVCTSDTDSICAPSLRQEYGAYIPPCDAQILINCISGVTAVNTSGQEFSGQFSKRFPVKDSNEYPADLARNLPAGTSPSVWTIPGVVNGGGTDTYLVRFHVIGDARSGEKFHSSSIDVSLFPITEKTGNYTLGQMTDANHPSGGCINDHYGCGSLGSEHSGNSDSLSAACVSFDIGLCALRQAFPEGYSFKISAKLGDSPTGWFHGRFSNPKISLSSSGAGTELAVEANPVQVPAVGILIKQADMTPTMKAWYAQPQNKAGISFGRLSSNGISNMLDNPAPSQSNVFQIYSLWAPLLKDQASATQTEWSFRTLELNGDNSSCFKDSTKLVGIVATNAMMYSGGAPAFNKSEGSLDYKVGAPHYASNGNVFKGSYDLQLRSDVARCLYGFTNAPIKATVSIASENGDSNVATTIVNEDPATGWLRMSASNFTFSNPTVKIKLTQDAPAPVASRSPSTSPVTAASPAPATNGTSKEVSLQKKITITCVKGKLSKSVTSSKPTCPSGYKRK